jgi:AcrR family transcriptional regulator
MTTPHPPDSSSIMGQPGGLAGMPTINGVDASAAPVRERGVRSRAGNAMQRTRVAVLDGAVRAVEKHGARRTTMADIAMLAGIAKGTLYNHFRTKEAVYAAAVEAGVRNLAQECASVAREDLAEAFALAAERLGSHPALRRIASDEPAVLASFVLMTDAPGWAQVREATAEVLRASGRDDSSGSVDLVVRWLTSFAASAGRDLEAQAAALAAGLPLAT